MIFLSYRRAQADRERLQIPGWSYRIGFEYGLRNAIELLTFGTWGGTRRGLVDVNRGAVATHGNIGQHFALKPIKTAVPPHLNQGLSQRWDRSWSDRLKELEERAVLSRQNSRQKFF